MEVTIIFILKLIELAITVACIVLWEIIGFLSTEILLVIGTIAGYAIICAIFTIGYIFNSMAPKLLNILFSVVGCILFIASGIDVILEWESDEFAGSNRVCGLTAGGLMIINSVVFLWEAILLHRGGSVD
ncbi:uncharacterized protein LOC119671588 isoform X2 [Teleopsis dalmanni]|uniref:uncharacterized protein LOC119669698 isoform X1 n=1 Tax=Teleopsis dalmanni TaxID=139649 RepID=UPI0018CEAE09|nr:uncharacterized protein LOC119669698 isoform X1 [Teleopsis dalmanni]XP_037935629.1 uncharacterized protein LOC119669698 isoform X2 [Teleopsis dalmanni]XP_037938217.1 uncharacterized protein LOC119671588 isoform X1 [Teleopsis dalmanni]XP_037938218.1 uncharacterized protein LOC119671588 isoform X2 [Teleopsis dalmanni]